MAKLSISKLIDASKFLATKPGSELADFITYVSDFSEQMIRALRNGLTFADNFNASVSTVELSNGVAQVVNTDKKQPMGILPLRVVSSTYRLDTFGWYVNGSGETVVTAGFTGPPSATIVKVNVTLAILF